MSVVMVIDGTCAVGPFRDETEALWLVERLAFELPFVLLPSTSPAQFELDELEELGLPLAPEQMSLPQRILVLAAAVHAGDTDGVDAILAAAAAEAEQHESA